MIFGKADHVGIHEIAQTITPRPIKFLLNISLKLLNSGQQISTNFTLMLKKCVVVLVTFSLFCVFCITFCFVYIVCKIVASLLQNAANYFFSKML